MNKVYNRYDQAGRYAAKIDPQALLRWRLGESIRLDGWLDTRSIPFPGEPDRTCDTVALVRDDRIPDEWWAVPMEAQMKPDPAMFGRLLEYLGRLWKEVRPEGRGERYHVGAMVLNLTGSGQSSRLMMLGSRIKTHLQVDEVDFASWIADGYLEQMQSGQAPKCLLPFIPLMQNADQSSTIATWKSIAEQEPNSRLRGDYGGLARVFAELTDHYTLWQTELENWNMVESPTVANWIRIGEDKGRMESLRETLQALLEDRFGTLPPALVAQIQGTDNIDILRAAIRQTLHISKLDELKL